MSQTNEVVGLIHYYYKDCLVSVSSITADIKQKGWANNKPPYQPENWDRRAFVPDCEQCAG